MKQLLFLILLFTGSLSYGQQTVSGTVTDESGQALIGANVMAKEASGIGTITDIDGNYRLQIPSNVTTLVFSYAGYETKEMAISGASTLNVSLTEGKLLDEIVVTALGVSRAEKSLGYSVQKVGAEQINNSNAVNAIDALAANVSGMQVISASGTAGAASRMVLRGTTNLNGDNEALLVIDGVRISNAENHSERSLAGVANSNRAIDINPNDIESYTVLKGAAASALYGVDAANGVILITTKKGKKGQQASLEYGFNLGFDNVNRFPSMQNKFSQGADGKYQAPSPSALRSWGAAIDTLSWDGATTNRFDKNGNIVGNSNPNAKTPVVPYDNLRNLYQTGITQSHNVSFLGGNDLLGFRIGAGYTTQQGVIPNNTFERFNVSSSTNSSFLNDKLKIETYANYSKSGGSRIQQGSNTSGLMLGLLRTPVTFDNGNGFENPWDNPESYVFADGTQRNYAGGGAGFDNAYWVLNNSPFNDEVNRFLGNFNVSYNFSKWLTLGSRIGTDVFTDNRKQAFEIGSRAVTGGRVFEDNYNYRNIDAYVQLSGGDKLTEKIGFNYLVGTNIYNEYFKQNYAQGDGLAFPNYLNLSNASTVASQVDLSNSKRVGFFGQVEGSYDGWLYLTLTGRQDYLSNLINPSVPFKSSDISVFYPSASLGIDITDFINSSRIDFAKLRLSFAQVGGGAPAAYLTSTNFVLPSFNQGTVNDFNDGWTNGFGFPFLGQSGFTLDAVRGAFTLTPSLTTEYEAGIDLRIAKRLVMDITGYSRVSADQILVVPVSGSSGFQRAVLNSGALSTNGLDISFAYDLIKNKDFNFRLNANFGTWRTYVDELAEGVDNQYIDGFTGSSVYNIAPERDAEGNITQKYEYGQIFGGAWLRTNDVVDGKDVYNPAKNYNPNGKLIINGDPTTSGYGYPIADPVNRVIGNPNPDFIMGFGATGNFKKLNFNLLFDWRQGGEMWNGTKGAMVNYGTHASTENRGTTVVFPGVIGLPSDNGYDITSQANNIGATLDEAWYRGNGGGFGAVSEHFIEDASSLRIRSVGISYDFGSIIGKSFKSLNIGVSANNILLWTPYDGIDPISSLVGSSSNGQGLDYFNNPAVRSFLVKLNARF